MQLYMLHVYTVVILCISRMAPPFACPMVLPEHLQKPVLYLSIYLSI